MPDAAGCSRRRAAAAAGLLAAAAAWQAALAAARAEAGESDTATRGGSAAAAANFYAEWPYVEPSDILPYLRSAATAGDVDSVLAAIDEFASYYPMYRCGPEKGAILERLVAQQQPKLVLELGTFMGYGCARMARQLAPGGRLVSIEASQEQAAVAREVLKLAGMPVGDSPGAQAQVISGLSQEVLPQLRRLVGLEAGQQADFVFLDHCKPCYLPDLLMMEQLGLVGPGTMIVADNVRVPGAPDFLAHVGASPFSLSQNPAQGGNSGGKDGTTTTSTSSGVTAAGTSDITSFYVTAGGTGLSEGFVYRTELIPTMFEVEQRYKESWQPQKDAMSVSVCLQGSAA